MFRTIARYGARHVSGTTRAVLKSFLARKAVRGSSIREFEEKFAAYHGLRHAVATSRGRMAFYYVLRALGLPSGTEIIFPALTFWVIPEFARVAGLRPVFVDIDPDTYNLDPKLIEPAVTERTRAIVPTHLYGQPCDVDAILQIAQRHNLHVIEDCAHALGATYRGAKVGTLGAAAFFSFQMLKGLNTFGGGVAVINDDDLARKVRALAEEEPWPSAGAVALRLLSGYLQRAFISPYGFTFSLFLVFYIASHLGHYDLSRYLWERIRPLGPLPASYRQRYSNVQALIGLQALDAVDLFNDRSRSHARRMTAALKQLRSVSLPRALPSTEPVYYQYCVRVSDPSTLSRRAIHRGIDIEIMHVDICPKLELFAPYAVLCPVAESTAETLQLPVYSRLRPEDVDRVIQVVREIAGDLPALPQSLPDGNVRLRQGPPPGRVAWGR